MPFRSPIIRWILAVIGLTEGVLLAFGDGHRWRSTPSLHELAKAPVPLQWWGLAFILYALMILMPKFRPVGFTIGAGVYAVFTISLFAALSATNPINAVVLGMAVCTVAFHVLAVRTAWLVRLAQ